MKKAIKKAVPRAEEGPKRVVLGVGRFACNDVYVNLRDERGWPMRLPGAQPLVNKTVRLVAEVLEDSK